MTKLISATVLVLGFLLFAVAQQTVDRTMASPAKGETVSQPTRKLFLTGDSTAFIDSDGRVVLSAAEPHLQEEIRRISRAFEMFREREEPETIGLRFGEFSEGFATVGWALCPMCRNPGFLNAIIDESGRVVIPPKTYHTGYGNFHEGLAKYTGQGWGFIDRSGRIVIPAKYTEVGDFSEGLAFVAGSERQRYGYINKEGRVVIPFRFTYASDFHEGLALVILRNVRYAFIDRTGKVVLQSQNWQGVDRFSEGLALVRISVRNNRLYRGYKEDKYGFMDRTGKLVIPPQFDLVERFSEGRAMVGQVVDDGTKWRDASRGPVRVGYIDRTGQVVIKPQYEWGKVFSEGLAAVAVMTPDKKRLWGYIDLEGRVVITPQFTNAMSFSGGLAAVNCDDYARNCKTYIDREGKVVWQAAGAEQ
ncbi:MAG TPA: WG repeat-containing protein [Pyrinomonadaceae bacterium]|nr:WG repeat-containing protein [Pyrinomonadaceae bacterium]